MNFGKLTLSRLLTLVLVSSTVAFSAHGKVAAKEAKSSFMSPKIGSEYGRAIAFLPDWNGYWLMTGGPSERARVMFDPDNVYEPPDPAGEIGGLDFGPRAGTYDTNIPYKPEYKKQYKELVQMALEGKSVDPLGACTQPHGMPRQMSGIPMAPEILITPNMVLMSWSYLGAQRRIYTDGRPHPEVGTIPAEYMGHSIGHWAGDTLVVDTVNMLAGMYDMSGAPFSDQIHVVERIRLVEKDLLENQITIEDPVMLERPWHVVRKYRRANPRYPNFVLEYCLPGTAVDMSKGYQEVVLPSELEKQRASKP
ncbi:MAG: hypothetical protein AB7T07_09345 [Steroidobacteraceae bacterium]